MQQAKKNFENRNKTLINYTILWRYLQEQFFIPLLLSYKILYTISHSSPVAGLVLILSYLSSHATC